MPLYHCEDCGRVITAARGADPCGQQVECPACFGTMRRAFHADARQPDISVVVAGAGTLPATDTLLAPGGQ